MFNIFFHLIFVCFQIVSCVLSAIWGHYFAQMLLRGYRLIGYGVIFAVFPFTFSSGLWQSPYAFISWSFQFILFGMGGSSWFCDLLSFAKLGKQTALISSNIGPPILYIPLTRMPAK